MSRGILDGLRVIEGSAFVAAPLGGMTLAQLGADVIRFDQIGGGLDQGRWPLAPSGESLFWAGLNKGKRSIQIDLRAPEGQRLVARLATAPGPGAGIFLTNLPARDLLTYEALRECRADVIMMQLTGNPDGSSEVDYTVNAAMGFPVITGPRGSRAPVNSVLPAWDIAMGEMAAIGILAAERHRTCSGAGSLVRLALSDVALAMAGALGRLAQAQLGEEVVPDGNYLYGAFGLDFATHDGRRVMVVALTHRQWTALKTATGLDAATLAQATDADLETEGGRYAARDAIATVLAPWFAARDLAEVHTLLDAGGVSWGPYQSFGQLLAEDPRASLGNPMFASIAHPGIGETLTASSPLDFSAIQRLPPRPPPRLGEHTDEILTELGLTSGEIGKLHDRGVVAGPGRK
ncbi:MAG: CoA transferase [Devosia nanyangense]|uniref:CoA transferase n=1 Tax=Devosia nanyangense TaxID=1228055 RepID=A0A933NY55_9HYPH|nr:CoA transferase [Devosia nanyangense]